MPARSEARTGTERRLRSEQAASRLRMPARSEARTGTERRLRSEQAASRLRMPARSEARTGTERRLRSEQAASRLRMPARSEARTGMSGVATYTRFEMLRLLRNKQNLVFSLAFPIVMYFLLAGPNKDNRNFGGDATHHTGLFAPQYYMVGLLAFGGMVAVLSGGARIAAERTVGWNRLLRLTPLSASGYLRTKILTGYLMAVLGIVLLYTSGI